MAGEQVLVWSLAGLYYVGMITIGVVVGRWVKSGADFLVAGRDVSWILQGLGLSSIVVAGTTLATQGAIGYLAGLAGHWWVTGWIIAVLIGAFAFTGFYRKTGAYTLSEWLAACFGKRMHVVASITLAIGCFFSPLANILGGGVVLSGLTGMSIDAAIVLVGVIVAIYLFTGGLWGALVTDLVQWIISAVAFLIVIPLFILLRSDASLWQSLPDTYWSLGSVPMLPWFEWTLPSIFGMFWLMFSIATGGFYWGRSCSTRTIRETRKAWILAVVVSIPFAFVAPLAGMYVRATGIVLQVPDQALGVFLQSIPVLARALCLVAILAATMSTVNAGSMAGATVLVRDLGKYLGLKGERNTKGARWITFLYTLAATAGAVAFNHFITVLGSVMALALLAGFLTSLIPPLLASMFWKRVAREGALLGVGFATLSTIYTMFFSDIWQRYHPVFTGFLVSLVVMVVVSLVVRYTRPWWREATDF